MRLIYTPATQLWHPRFTLAWEIEHLVALPKDTWVPFCLPGQTRPIGHIHAHTHEITLLPDVKLSNNQIVSLAPTSLDTTPPAQT
jgi:hypothetical protein